MKENNWIYDLFDSHSSNTREKAEIFLRTLSSPLTPLSKKKKNNNFQQANEGTCNVSLKTLHAKGDPLA